MSNGKGVRALPWLRTRSSPALESKYRDDIIEWARNLSPNGAYNKACDMLYLETGDIVLAQELAKACRWLAVIKRDHGKEAFALTISSKPNLPRLITTERRRSHE